jgi:hypothetical protein
MAATKTLQDSINWMKPFLNWANLAIGTGLEPAFTSANQALQTIVGPPFVWPWNRSYATFLTTVGTQDYNAAISDFGFLEAASIELCGTITSVVTDGVNAVYHAINGFSTLSNGGVGEEVVVTGCTTSALNGRFTITAADSATFAVASTVAAGTESESGAIAVAGKSVQLELKWGALSEERATDRPTFISTQMSDDSGTTFTFRLMPVPDQNYRVNLTYQSSPLAFVRLSDTWEIPDQLQYIYNYFFAFFMFDYFEDPRAARYRQLAVASLLARQSGLSITDRNLFLGNWLPLMKEEQESQAGTSQAVQGRGI